MRGFATILTDAVRLLRAQALFWVTLALSAVAALLYLSIGFNERGISFFFGWQVYENAFIREGSTLAEVFYLVIFSMVVVNVWLSWIAVVLALITCAPIFPSFMAEGRAGLTLSQPISRLRLYTYKYLSGLLFALLQTAIFTVIVVIAIRWRIGVWNLSVCWAVPLVVLMFSYLWSVMVAVGVWTRSTMMGLMGALLVWAGAWLAKLVDEFAWSAAEQGQLVTAESGLPLSADEQASWRQRRPALALPYTVLPKTSDTVNALSRLMVVDERGSVATSEVVQLLVTGEPRRDEAMEAAMERHSLGMIFGSSLAFEAVFFVLGAWKFCRRDY